PAIHPFPTRRSSDLFEQERRDESGDNHRWTVPSSGAGSMRLVNIVFVEPAFPPTQRHFVRALAEVGATVIGIGERHQDALDDQLRSWMTHYHQVPTVVDVGVMTDAVRWIQDKVWVDRLEATIEAHTLAAAQVRENC